MIRWCMYCQKFQGEVEPFDSFEYTHGICVDCHSQGLKYSDEGIEKIKKLKALQDRLWKAGRNEDFPAAKALVTEATNSGVRLVDILIGLITPLLYQIGKLWETGKITVEEEHRFTAFCEKITSLIAIPTIENPEIIIACPKNNHHTLGTKIMTIWLHSKGVKCSPLYIRNRKDGVEAIVQIKPRIVGFSASLQEHVDEIEVTVQEIKQKLNQNLPRFVIGGRAVRSGSTSKEPGIETVQSYDDLLKIIKS